MIYIESPKSLLVLSETSIFLAGGIANCPDWQQDMRGLLKNTNLTLLNPRRASFPIYDADAVEIQITWEHNHLRRVNAILFWFPCETLCPIVLYELGTWSMGLKQIFVGVHPEYLRRQDVEIQTLLAKPNIKIVYSLEDLASQVIGWNRSHE